MWSVFSNTIGRGRAARAGVTSLEFGLVGIAFFAALLTLVDLANYVMIVQSVAVVTQESQRICFTYANSCPASGNASGFGNCWGWPFQLPAWDQLSVIAPMLQPDLFDINGCLVSGTYGVTYMQLRVAYPFTPLSPWLAPIMPTTVSQTASYFN